MSTYHCALVRYDVMPTETAQSAEWLWAVCTVTISQSRGIQIFTWRQRERERETVSRIRSVPSPKYTGGNLSQKMDIMVV